MKNGKIDLTKNALLDNVDDKTKDAVNTAFKSYNKYSTIIEYLMYAKFVMMAAIFGLVIWGGFIVVGMTQTFVKELAVETVKTEAKEKTAELKAKVGDKKPADLFSAVSQFAQKIKVEVNEGFDSALENNGYHPDAPNFCVLDSAKEADSLCVDYTDTELSKADYSYVNTMWKSVCPMSHKGAMDLLKTNGKITYNDKRELSEQCQADLAVGEANEREEFKQKLLEQ